MEDLKFSKCVIDTEKLLRNVCWIIKKKGREILEDFKITAPQFEALQHLVKHNSLTIGELSENMGLACSTITDLIDRMERNDLVARERNESDRRVVKVLVLDKGRHIIEKVLDSRRDYLSILLEDIDIDERNSFIATLQRINESAENYNSEK
jgi:MarR family transcriptional regulator, organic hydroperoxide resistance regulator